MQIGFVFIFRLDYNRKLKINGHEIIRKLKSWRECDMITKYKKTLLCNLCKQEMKSNMKTAKSFLLHFGCELEVDRTTERFMRIATDSCRLSAHHRIEAHLSFDYFFSN